jgi:hypothetical protein
MEAKVKRMWLEALDCLLVLLIGESLLLVCHVSYNVTFRRS